jgi:phage terminase large subunit-like protein
MNVFGEAMNMVKTSPSLTKRLELVPSIKRINCPKTNSWYQTLSADAATAEGKNISFLIYDELHAAFGRDLYRALMGGGISRRQPLMLAITTAGQNAEGSLCFDEYTHAKAVLEGDITDESYFAFVAEGNPALDPGDPENWKLANPGLGVSPRLEALEDRWTNAQGSPEKINDFKQYHLNYFVQRADNAIPFEVWDKGGVPFDSDELLGQSCYGGLDLGSISDLTALSLVFPQDDGSYRV